MSTSLLATHPPDLDRRRRLLVLAICCAGIVVVVMDISIVNVALPSIRRDLDASVSGLQWTVDAYTLVLAGFLLLAGSTADRVGRRRIFQLGLAAFGLGSLLCSLAPSIGWLIAARALQAVGGTMLNPVAMAIVASTFPDRAERARAIGVFGAMSGLALGLGPILGGALVDGFGWRSVFWVNVPIVVAAIICTRLFVPESRATRARRFDPVGQALVIMVLGSLVYAIIESGKLGWTSPVILALLAVAVLGVGGLLAYEPRRTDPLLELRLFRSVPFSSAILKALFALCGFSAFLFVTTQYLQDVRGLSALAAGLCLLPVGVLIIVLSPSSGRLVGARGPRLPLVVAGTALALGGLASLWLGPDTPLPAVLAIYLLFGIALGTVNPPITNTAISGMPTSMAGVAASLASVGRQTGTTIGVAISGAMVAAATARGGAPFTRGAQRVVAGGRARRRRTGAGVGQHRASGRGHRCAGGDIVQGRGLKCYRRRHRVRLSPGTLLRMGFLSAPATVDKREYWGFSLYDWANSGYVTTVGTVLFAPYLTSVAETAACGRVGTTEDPCHTNLQVLGLGISPGSLAFYVVTVATLISALFLPVVGAIADRSPRKKLLMCGFAWVGALAACSMVFVTDGRWALGALLLFIGNLCLGSSLVVYDSILIDIAGPDDRDDVSSRAWAFGYLGGFILLAINLGVVTAHDALGMSQATAVRLSLLSAGLWWGLFTFIPYLRLRDRPPASVVPVGGGSLIRQSFGQLFATLRHIRTYPMTLLFLVAYLFFNDGIQTVISVSSTYGEKQLGFETQVLIMTILLVQFIAFFGALAFGRFARRFGSQRTIMGGLVIWMVIVIAGFLLPAGQIVPFLAMGAAIGIVLGGTQALSRSAFSQLIPKGREAEYFSLYQAGERGTSWLGTLVFGLVHQITGSYRPAIVALGFFFVIGLALLSRVDMRRGIREAGNTQPTLV